MIKFEILSEENVEALAARLASECDGSAEETAEVIESFLSLIDEGDIEVGVCSVGGCLVARIFDMGRYMFVYPIELSESADAHAAISAIREYARLEELPLVITDIPRECLGELAPLFNHTVIDAEEGGESFRLEARSECALLDEVPSVILDGITLDEPREEDIPSLARLNRDRELNKYWGYDYREDAPSAPDGYFLEVARRELYMGTAITLAGRLCGEYIGECVIYGFDLSGGAEVGVRILPEHQGSGFGTRALFALSSLARDIGLGRLYCRVLEENLPSLRLMRKVFLETRREDGKVYFEKIL